MSRQDTERSDSHNPGARPAALGLGNRKLLLSPENKKTGLRLHIRGRSLKLRGLRRPVSGWASWLLILGPGLIAACAGNDAGGIATYSQAGARYGYSLIWVMLLITVSLAVVQETCARLGAATGRGLLDLIREQFGVRWSLFSVIVILIANGGMTLTEFLGVGAAGELLGFNKLIVIPLAASVLWYLVVYGSYASVEKVFIAMSVVFFAYPVAAFLGHPHWGEVARGAFSPHLQKNPAYLFLLVGLMGTTITPYMQLFQQSALVDRGVSRGNYGAERADTYFGAVFSNLMSIFMMIATAATLHVAGIRNIETAADAARALEPAAGASAKILFAIGLLGASLLAGAVLPLATSYAICETFGTPKGINLNFRQAHEFFWLFTAILVFGAVAAMVPGVPVIKLLILMQVLNGALLPIILVFVLLLINNENLTGALKNNRLNNCLGWGTFSMITVAVVIMLGSQLQQAMGLLRDGPAP